MSRSRDIAKILGVTEDNNPSSSRILFLDESLDSARVTSIADTTAPSLTVYDSINELPVQSLTAGAQAYVRSNNKLYVTLNNAYYNIATVNLTPTVSLDPSGTIVLSDSGQPSAIVTINATDSDGSLANLTYTVESDGNMLGRATLTQDSSVFTIDPLTADSGATTGTFTLTFKANDGINIGTAAKDFSLTFAAGVDSSAPTVLLMKAAGNSATNAAITYQNSSDVSTGFTETGDPQAGTFSPYRSGGYSAYFDGTTDWIEIPDGDWKTWSNNFTIEGWFYIPSFSSGNRWICGDFASTGLTSTSSVNIGINHSQKQLINYTNISGSTQTLYSASNSIEAGKWHHFAVVRESTSNYTLYLDGVSVDTATNAGTITNSTQVYSIGRLGAYDGAYFNGYVSDLRAVNGTAVYTSAFTPPTERLTAVTNTSLLACHLPYFVDGSTYDHTITVNGDTKTLPFGPYDYLPWTADDHGGSTFFDGSSDMTAFSLTSIAAGNYTVEFWCYPTKNLTDQQTLLHFREASGNGGTNIWFGGASGANMRVDNGLVGQSSFTGKALVLNTWNHIAITRNSTTTTCYINGVSAGSHTYTPAASNRLTIGRFTATPYYFNGYLSDVRYTAGSVVYSAAFTPPTAPLGHITNTNLLMNNKSDANVYDAAAANGLTLVGNTQSSTTQRKFTTSSAVYFDGTGDYISENNSDLFAFGTGDFTVEAWIYYSTFSGSGGQAIVSTGTSISSGTAGHWYLTAYGASDLRFGRHGSSQYNSATTSTLSVNTWHHLAVTREGTTVKIFVDGVQTGGTSVAGGIGSYDFNNSSGYLFVGEGASFSSANGYIQDLRITKGHARYTGAFTPPTAEFDL